MRESRKANSYVPSVYKGFTEMEQIVNVDDVNIDAAERALKDLVDNQWILTANESGIKAYEDMLGIIPDLAEESLQFRRDRLINRFSNRMPFTIRAFKQKLDAVIGADNYSLTIDNDNYTIYLQSSSVNQIWYTETMVTISGMKPCNMIFVNNPLMIHNISLSEIVYVSSVVDNYTLGEGFKLGIAPFATIQNEEVIKMASTPSFTDKLINDVSSFTANAIAFISVDYADGRSSLITEFATKAAVDNVITIEYDVPAPMEEAIVSIELYDAGASKLSGSTVYIPPTDNVRIKHTIMVKEAE